MVASEIAGHFSGFCLGLDQESLRALALRLARIIPGIERRSKARVRILYDQPNNHDWFPSSPFIRARWNAATKPPLVIHAAHPAARHWLGHLLLGRLGDHRLGGDEECGDRCHAL